MPLRGSFLAWSKTGQEAAKLGRIAACLRYRVQRMAKICSSLPRSTQPRESAGNDQWVWTMNFKVGDQEFFDVEVPLLWGKRAFLHDIMDKISIVALHEDGPVIEILADKPTENVQHEVDDGKLRIFSEGKELYTYEPETKTIAGVELKLPICQIQELGFSVDLYNYFGKMPVGDNVGLLIDEKDTEIGAPLPESLANAAI